MIKAIYVTVPIYFDNWFIELALNITTHDDIRVILAKTNIVKP